MERIQINTPFNVSLSFFPASTGKRILANLIDLTIMFLYAAVVIYLIDEMISDLQWRTSLKGVLISIPLLFYHLISEISTYGQSIGKRIMNIRVMCIDGSTPDISHFCIRSFFRFWEWFCFFVVMFFSSELLIGFFLIILFAGTGVALLVLVTKNNQRLGDLSAGTVVVNTKIKSSIHDTIFTQVSTENYTVKFPQAAQLSDSDLNKIKAILNEFMKKGNDKPLNMAAEKIKTTFQISTDMHNDLFLQQLIVDYNYLTTKGN